MINEVSNYLLFVCTVKLFQLSEVNISSERSRCERDCCKATEQTLCSMLVFASVVLHTISSIVNLTNLQSMFKSVVRNTVSLFLFNKKL